MYSFIDSRKNHKNILPVTNFPVMTEYEMKRGPTEKIAFRTEKQIKICNVRNINTKQVHVKLTSSRLSYKIKLHETKMTIIKKLTSEIK